MARDLGFDPPLSGYRKPEVPVVVGEEDAMPRGSSPKRERQYEHIKDSAKARGASDQARQGDRRADRQQGAGALRRGEDRLEDLDPGHLVGSPGRAALRLERAAGADPRSALRRGQEAQHQGPLEDEQGAAAPSGGRQEVAPGTRARRPPSGRRPATSATRRRPGGPRRARACRRACRRRSSTIRWRRLAARSPSPGTRSMTSITRWKRSRSLSITMSKGVVVVPSSM